MQLFLCRWAAIRLCKVLFEGKRGASTSSVFVGPNHPRCTTSWPLHPCSQLKIQGREGDLKTSIELSSFKAKIYPVSTFFIIWYYSSLQSHGAAMGIDAGFDMVPRLSRGVVDRQNWNRFIDIVKEHYKNDTQVEFKPNYIVFKAGEHPRLPLECHKFLRFSSKIPGRIAATTKAESYIDTVTRIARVNFGSRVQYWNEGVDQRRHYDWHEVHESIKSYEQVRHTSSASLSFSLNASKPISYSRMSPRLTPLLHISLTVSIPSKSLAFRSSKSRTSQEKAEAWSLVSTSPKAL